MPDDVQTWDEVLAHPRGSDSWLWPLHARLKVYERCDDLRYL